MVVPINRASANTGTPARRAKVAKVVQGAARLPSRVLVCLTRPFAYARRTCDDTGGTIGMAVSRARTILRVEAGSRPRTRPSAEHRPEPPGERPDLLPDSNGRCSRQRRQGSFYPQ